MRFIAGLVLSLAIIIPASTHATNAQVFGTRSDLYSNCLDSGRMVNFSICVGYIMGVWDAFIADDEIVGTDFCLPPKHP